MGELLLLEERGGKARRATASGVVGVAAFGGVEAASSVRGCRSNGQHGAASLGRLPGFPNT